MTASEYCTRADLYNKGGLPRGLLPNPGRAIAVTSTATEVFTLDGHGFEDDAELRFRAEAGGSLPAPLVAGTTYYAIPVSDSTFSVAATAGGSAIDITSAGSNVVVITPIPFEGAIQWASATLDDHIPAHVVPFEAPYPVTLVTLCAQLAAAYLLNFCGQSREPMTAITDNALKRLEGFTKGLRIRGANAPATSANLAVTGSASGGDPRDWNGSSSLCGGGSRIP